MDSKKFSANNYIFTVVVLLVASLIGIYSSQMAYSNIQQLGWEIAPLVDACMEVKVSVTEAHLWFEETMTDYEAIDGYERANEHLDEAKFYAGAILSGGENEEGVFYPIKNDKGRLETEKVSELIDEFGLMSRTRYENLLNPVADDRALDVQYDAIYTELMERIDRVETIVQEEMAYKIEQSKTNVMWVAIFYALTMVLSILLILVSFRSIRRAHDASPLTNLPGNASIQKHIRHQLKSGEDSSIIYVDLDNFKIFNDTYGFSRGDNVIRFTARILQEQVLSICGQSEFIGHIGGDDFVLIMPRFFTEEFVSDFINKFDKEILRFYRKSDLRDKRFVAVNKSGAEETFPILSISLAVVHVMEGGQKNYRELMDACTESKIAAKSIVGSSYYIYEETNS